MCPDYETIETIQEEEWAMDVEEFIDCGCDVNYD